VVSFFFIFSFSITDYLGSLMSDNDFGDTDLGLETSFSFSEHTSQEIAPEEEVAPADAAGNIVGRVALDKKGGTPFPGQQTSRCPRPTL